VTETGFIRPPVTTLHAGDLEADFAPGAGMVCSSLRLRGEELLGQRKGLEAYASSGSTMGIPLLYPWANRLSERRFELAGQTVDLDRAPGRFRDDGETGLPIHGAKTAGGAWTVEADDRRSLRARFDWGADEELMAAFPFAHRATYEAALDEDGGALRLSVSVDRRVPVAFGLHPYFALGDGDQIEAPVRERLVLDERKLPTGERAPAAPLAGARGTRDYDDAYVAPRGPCVLAGKARTITARLEQGFGFLQVFAPAGEEIVSFEPMTAPADALVSGRDLPTGPHTGTFVVEVG
jgi:galactose mutarotase-like enzyme